MFQVRIALSVYFVFSSNGFSKVCNRVVCTSLTFAVLYQKHQGPGLLIWLPCQTFPPLALFFLTGDGYPDRLGIPRGPRADVINGGDTMSYHTG